MRFVEQLVEGDAEKLSRKMLELAKKGNVRCLEYCLDRLLPKRSGRPLECYAKIFTVYDLAVRLDALELEMKRQGLDLTPSQKITKFGAGSD